MKNLIKSITIFTVCLFFYSAANAQITYDLDKEADFTSFKTYSFGGWQDGSDKLVNDIDKKRILESFKSELYQRGMEYKMAEADVIITIYLVIDEKTSATAYTDYYNSGMGMGMGYGYGRGYYRPGYGYGVGMGMGSSTTTYSEKDYRVGTFVVDMYDAKTKKLVWQVVDQQTIQENGSKRAKSIPKGAKKIMKKYPIDIIKK